MPRIENGKEVLSWLLYDSITLGAADVQATLFTQPQGSGTKTVFDTNMKEAGKLPWPEEFTFKGIRLACLFDNTDALLTALMKGTMSLIIGAKSYMDLPLFRMTAASGLFIAAHDDTTAATVRYGQAGRPHAHSLYTFAVPLTLEPGEVFRVELVWPVAPTAQKLYIGFDGTLRRAIQ